MKDDGVLGKGALPSGGTGGRFEGGESGVGLAPRVGSGAACGVSRAQPQSAFGRGAPRSDL